MASSEVRLRLAENGRVVIPAEVRKDLGLESGGELILERQENGYRMTTRRHRIEEARKYLRRFIKPGDSVVDELIAERREAAKHE
ncbi:MAG TPA: AbrB/MazE/SpoVT family DNA-binding domain-containing protein [Acidobacteriaceae bacterium]|jgi:AbrB family looped-hinge helix DNA binding protein|nr:AbrB/MazE/SpoVT family DNA-binding domain-containing protein [Acidobacteriaceae bacterium]